MEDGVDVGVHATLAFEDLEPDHLGMPGMRGVSKTVGHEAIDFGHTVDTYDRDLGSHEVPVQTIWQLTDVKSYLVGLDHFEARLDGDIMEQVKRFVLCATAPLGTQRRVRSEPAMSPVRAGRSSGSKRLIGIRNGAGYRVRANWWKGTSMRTTYRRRPT
jgi:hypothetical protein